MLPRGVPLNRPGPHRRRSSAGTLCTGAWSHRPVMKHHTDSHLDRHVDAIRGFNRFYTRQVGALGDHLLDSPFSLAEARVLFEVAHREKPTATEVGTELQMDAGYLSRILRRLQKLGLIARGLSEVDRRQNLLWLTKKGQKAFAELDASARDEIAELLRKLSSADQDRLLQAMRTIAAILG